MSDVTTAPSLDVHLVEPEREVWSGAASFLIARSAGGDIGVLPGHEPVFSLLGIGPVRIDRLDDGRLQAAVDGGFLSVVGTTDGVTRVDVLAEHVTLESEITGDEIAELDRRGEQLRQAGEGEEASAEEAKAGVRRRLTS